MRHPRHRRASPWFVLSGSCFMALAVLGGLCLVMAGASNSVVGNPRGRPPEELLSPGALAGQGDGEYPFPLVDWDYWKGVNPAVVAWVTVPGTGIDYAVVQALPSGADYYLSHDVYRGWNPYGCPYVDAGCPGMAGSNTVIFGHNMGDGASMFSQFARFSDEGYARDHSLVLLQTPDARLALTVSAVDVVSGHAATKKTRFGGQGEFASWYAERLSEADVRLGADPRPRQAFTFVTCSYNYFSNERTLVFAVPRTQTERNTL